MKKMKRISEVSNKPILIDTNVLIYCGQEGPNKEARKILRTLADNKNTLGISLISGFEIIKKFNNKNVIDYYLKLINYLTTVDLNIGIMNMAGLIANVYVNPEEHKKDNDMIIGATVAKQPGSMLLTANRKDFPSPLWKLIARKYIHWNNGEKRDIVNVYLLEFDHKEFKEEMKKNKK